MSAHGSSKIPLNSPAAPIPPEMTKKNLFKFEPICGFCELPFSRQHPPVLLASGHSVHIDCYLHLYRHPELRPKS